MNIQRILRICVVFVLTAIATTVLACIIGTQFVLADLNDVGIAIPFGVRIATTWHDVVNLGFIPSPSFGFSYGQVITVGFLFAFLAAAAVSHLLPRFRIIIYTTAGAVAFLTQLELSSFSFGVTMYAFARTPLGLAAQALAGAMGGWLFAKYTARGETA